MVSSSKFQPSDEGGAAAANPVVTTTTGSRRRAKEAYPNLSHKLPMEEGVIKEGVVFVVDYDASCRATLNELFESVGLKVKLYASGSAFLEDRFPDATSCIVLAVRLPGMSGLKIQGELARAGVHIPIIFLTGHGDILMAVHAMKAGAVDFLTKPFRNQDLLDAVFTALEQDRARREKEESHSTLRQNFESLTSREREVIARVAAGDLNKQIAADLGVSEVTVKLHRANAMRKMRAKTVADLVRMIEHVND
jgi:FixJ family two-component response regulator